jgi:hypothetical protein
MYVNDGIFQLVAAVKLVLPAWLSGFSRLVRVELSTDHSILTGKPNQRSDWQKMTEMPENRKFISLDRPENVSIFWTQR